MRKDAHKLIEEFMLLGNVAVAEKIHRTFPDLAFLRCHPPPNQEASEKLVKDMEAHGISIDTASSKTLANSLTKIVDEVSFVSSNCIMTSFFFIQKNRGAQSRPPKTRYSPKLFLRT